MKGAITTGVVLAIIIGIALSYYAGTSLAFHPMRIDRWLHIVSGITWIGLLYYFNVVQTPGLAAAVATWVTGACYLIAGYGAANGLVQAFLLQPGFWTIGVGAWLGTIMLFNVWVFIWPKQKKIPGIVPATDDEKAAARKIAAKASRINFIPSLPMIMCGQAHGLPF